MRLADVKLKHVSTRVRTADGRVFVEDAAERTRVAVGREDTLIAAAVDETLGRIDGENVYIGAHDAALNEAVLLRHGITHVLNVAFGTNAFAGRFRYDTAPLLDTDSEPLTRDWLEERCRFIDDGNTASHAVLVHCNMGVSRSATVVIAWLMLRHGLSYEAAFARVKAARPVIAPNAGFVRQLTSL